MQTLNLNSRFQAAYGFIPVINSPQPIPGSQYMPYPAVKVYTEGDSTFEDMHLKNEKFDLVFGGRGLSKTGGLANVFAPPAMIGYRQAKRHEITPVGGGVDLEGNDIPAGEVVERWGTNSWEIRMNGLLVDMAEHHYPLNLIKTLRLLFQVDDVCEVAGQIFDALGIPSIYFTEIEFNPLQGFSDTISYNLNARSITPVEFYINGEV